MVKKITQDYPGLAVEGYCDGYITATDMPALIQDIKQKKPDILFVALGTPRQEYWINEHLNMLQVPVCIGLGGSFDVLAGLKKDCPNWVRALAMEWLFRTLQDPKNLWKRYAVTIPWFLSRVFSEKMRLTLGILEIMLNTLHPKRRLNCLFEIKSF